MVSPNPTANYGAAKLDIEFVKGDTIAVPLSIYESGAQPNLSGRTYTAEVRKTPTGSVVATMTVDTAGAANGNLVLRLTNTQTAALVDGNHVFKLTQNQSGTIRTLISGNLVQDLQAEATHGSTAGSSNGGSVRLDVGATGTIALIVYSGTGGTSGDVNTHLADTSDAHDASAISILDAAGLYTATDVEAALAEVRQVANSGGGGAGATNLSYNSSTRLLSSSTGTGVTLPLVTTSLAGLMASTDKTKLDGIAAGAQVNSPTNLTYDSATRILSSSTGTGATLPLATTSVSGLMSAADKTKLDGISGGGGAATNLSYDSATRVLSSSTGTGTTLPLVTTSVAGLMASTDKTKLDGIAAGAQVNSPTNLSYDSATRVLSSSTGSSATLPLATTTVAGLMSAADKTKLDGISGSGGATNLSYDSSTRVLSSSTGTGTTLPLATTTVSGLMSAADKTKLDGITGSGGGGTATNLTYDASTRIISSSTGTGATLPLVTTSLAGLMASADKTKLDGVQAGAQANVATNLSYDSSTRVLSSSTGTSATLPVATTAISGLMLNTDKTKLDGIQAGAQVNVPTNLGYTASTRVLTSSTGSNVTLPVATTTDPGLMAAADKSKLDGISATTNPLLIPGAQVMLTWQTTAVSGVATNGWYRKTGVNTFTLMDATALANRVCSITWQGTSAQIPAQGTGAMNFQKDDSALIRSATL